MADEKDAENPPEESPPSDKGETPEDLMLGGGRPSLRNLHVKRVESNKEASSEKMNEEDSGSEENVENSETSHESVDPHDPHHDHDHDDYHDDDHDPYHHDDYHDPDHEDYYHEHEDLHHHDPEDDWWEEDEKDEEDELPAEGEMSLLDHLEDLRWTLFKSVGALVLGCVIVGVNVRFFADILQQPIEYAVSMSTGRVLIVTDQQELHSVNPSSGKPVWVYPEEGKTGRVKAKPIIGDKKSKHLYTVVDNSVVALQKRTGKEVWRFEPEIGELEPSSLRLGAGESLFVSGVAGLSETGGAVYAVNAHNGKKDWEYSTGQGLAYAPLPDMDDEDIDLRTRQPLGVMMVLLQVVFFGGLAISLPFIVMFASGFVAPGLTKREKRMLLPGSITAVVLFLMGAALAFFFIVPVSLKFSIVLNDWLGIELLFDVNDYYSLVVMVTLAVGALFQFPLLLVILGYLGVLSAKKLRGARQIVFVIILIVAALLTPGDVIVALGLLTVPLYGMFEGSILMVAYVEKAKARKQARIDARRKQREEARQQSRKKAAEALQKIEPKPDQEENPSTEGEEKQK